MVFLLIIIVLLNSYSSCSFLIIYYIILTGFGIHPKLLSISRVRPDVVFHLCTTKWLLKQLKCMLEQQSFEVQETFSEELMVFFVWGTVTNMEELPPEWKRRSFESHYFAFCITQQFVYRINSRTLHSAVRY